MTAPGIEATSHARAVVCLSDHKTDYPSYARAVRLGRPSGDATVYELFGWLMAAERRHR